MSSKVMVEEEECACVRATLSFQGTGLGKDHGPVEMGATSVRKAETKALLFP